MARKQHRRHKTKRRQRGAGYFDDPKNMITAGYIAHVPYGGAAMGNGPKDCTGNPMSHRPGWIDDLKPVGLPGMKGGSRKQRKRRGGAAYPNAASLAGAVINPVPETMKAELAQNMPGAKMSMPGVPTPAGAQVAQKGGRYMAGPFGPVGGPNGIGASPIGAQVFLARRVMLIH